MRIIIYKNQQPYLIHDFPRSELDKIEQICYNENIKWYIIVGEK